MTQRATTRPRLVITGASGRLGSELTGDTAAGRALAETYDVTGATSADADVRDADAVQGLLEAERPDVVLHAAAYTDVAKAEAQRSRCWAVNVAGTRHVADAAAAVGARLIHVSTDYVFWGGEDRPEGGYREDDPVGPVRNYYALTKLVAEEAARRAPRPLIVRTSFRAGAWPYPVAFTDLFTSQDYVDVIADELIVLLRHHDRIDAEVVHLATERKSVFDLAVRRTPEVQPGSKHDVGVPLPDDVSLSTRRWRALKRRFADGVETDGADDPHGAGTGGTGTNR